MATQQITIDYILRRIDAAGVIQAKKMFGEYGIYCDGKIVALVCDDRLFIKPTQAGLKFIGDVTEDYPYPGAKPYFMISREKWNDDEWLTRLIQISAAELPVAKKKR
jgi:TfoX/Sxy family transcriptional regulator of competence genes